MSYRMLEELQNRRKEKVAVFLTFEHIVALIVVFFPVFLGSASLPFLIRGPLCVGAALLGLALTLEAHGLPIYAQLLWRARGLLRLRLRGTLITPDDLPGTIPPAVPERALPLDGPIRAIARARPRHLAQRRATSSTSRAQGDHDADPTAE